MIEYYAHSPKGEIPAQSYTDHIVSVANLNSYFVNKAIKLSQIDKEYFKYVSRLSCLYHDLGKLTFENQSVLSGERKSNSLPQNHADAGAACLLELNEQLCASLVSSHHKGFPDFSLDRNLKEDLFRTDGSQLKAYIDQSLPELISTHKQLIPKNYFPDEKKTLHKFTPNNSTFLRLLLSCLNDADHTDTAINYGESYLYPKYMDLRAEERLKKLDDYIESFKVTKIQSKRNQLRNDMYYYCRNSNIEDSIVYCDSPVGSGKTTAIMANLLKQASKRNLTKIFVILPYTNIIKQSVDVYRKLLTLPGENPNEVVAELHHKADFENYESRKYSSLWRAPIIVTTAVSFFETLASNTPSSLRKLHELAGSAIFVDESHACLPKELLNIAWYWINAFADDWGCYWVLASGSLCKFWEINSLTNSNKVVKELVSSDISSQLHTYEVNRVSYKYKSSPMNLFQLADWVSSFDGPRLIIMNTIQSSAYLAKTISDRLGPESVEYLSTALTPEDRDNVLNRIKKRLQNPNDTDWYFIATSCVEAGVDLSFKIGFRESSSLSSLLQSSGRVNREGKFEDSEVWTFNIVNDGKLLIHPNFVNSSQILNAYFENNIKITPDLVTKTISKEIEQGGLKNLSSELLQNEKSLNFKKVENEFNVISSNSKLTVVDNSVADDLKFGFIDWQALQKVSVQIPFSILKKVGAEEVIPGIYKWPLEYSSTLGYMEGYLKNLELADSNFVL